MLDPVRAIGSLRDLPIHESTVSHPNIQLALEAIKLQRQRVGHRTIARACCICRGWHLQEVTGRA